MILSVVCVGVVVIVLGYGVIWEDVIMFVYFDLYVGCLSGFRSESSSELLCIRLFGIFDLLFGGILMLSCVVRNCMMFLSGVGFWLMVCRSVGGLFICSIRLSVCIRLDLWIWFVC